MMTMTTTTPQFHNEDDDSLTSMKVKAVATVEKEKDEIILVPMAGGEEEDTNDDDVEKVDEHDDKPVTMHPVGLARKHRSLSTSSLSTLTASFKSVLTHTPHNMKSASSSPFACSSKSVRERATDHGQGCSRRWTLDMVVCDDGPQPGLFTTVDPGQGCSRQ